MTQLIQTITVPYIRPRPFCLETLDRIAAAGATPEVLDQIRSTPPMRIRLALERVVVEWRSGIYLTLEDLAEALNLLGETTPTGAAWTPSNLRYHLKQADLTPAAI